MTKDYGGHAYPMVGQLNNDQYICEFGMTLRDWFAGQALAESTREIWSNHKPEDVAARCYQLADAMIAERNK